MSQLDPTLRLFPPPRKGFDMDLNVVWLAGRLAAPPEIRQFDSGNRLVRYLVTVCSTDPKRVDVVPITLWNPPDDVLDADPAPGQRLHMEGAVQRRFWSGSDGRRSRLEIVADHVDLGSADEAG